MHLTNLQNDIIELNLIKIGKHLSQVILWLYCMG